MDGGLILPPKILGKGLEGDIDRRVYEENSGAVEDTF